MVSDERAGSIPGPFVASGARRRTRRVALTAFLAVVVGGLGVLAAPARADESRPRPPGPVSIGGGLDFTGAVVTGPLPAATSRRLDAYTTAVFVQSWLPGGIFGPPPVRSQPPPAADRYRVDVTGTWDGAGARPTTWTIYYAEVPGQVWIACPRCRATPTEGAPDYWVAPPRVADALAGRAELIPVLALETTTTAPTPRSGGSSAGGSSLPGAAAGGLVALVAITAVALIVAFRRRGAPPGRSAPPSEG